MGRERVKTVALMLSVVMLQGACSTRMMPPPRVPERTAPTVVADLPAPSSGNGQVTFDAVGGPARVEEITARTQPSTWMYPSRSAYGMAATGDTLRPVCVTPCVVHLPYGPHEMRFSSLRDDERYSSDFVTVGQTEVIFRHALGRRENHWGERIAGIFTVAIGFAAAVFGGTMWALSSVSTDRSGSADTREALGRAGIGTLIGGGVALGVGVGLLIDGRPLEQRGSSVQWPAR